MPIHKDTGRLEHAIDSGHIAIMTDDGARVPAYWAHPRLGQKFPAIALLHDWWGFTNAVRLLTNYFAMRGYYVIAPDMFGGKRATTPAEANRLLTASKGTRFAVLNTTLTALERHMNTNEHTAAIGLGVGGTLAFRAALQRTDIEAAVSMGGFPQGFIGYFKQAKTPILALYGSQDPFIGADVVAALRTDLAQSPIASKHQVEIIDGAGHEFFSDTPDPQHEGWGRQALNLTLTFLDKYLEQPKSNQPNKPY